MKVYNEQTDSNLTQELQSQLERFRLARGFNPKTFLELKAQSLNQYMRESGLKSCVVAVSGGIDSAIVLGIVARAATQQNSPIQKIVPVMLPVFNSEGATNQESATEKGQEVAKTFGLNPVVIDLSSSFEGLKTKIDGLLSVKGEGWASGQLIPYMRTPTLYYITSLLSQEGLPSIICGTTNKDEGAYLGYFGKASDGMVDVQLISDLHKSEVFAVGLELGVPESIMKSKPTGDMYDGRVDEEVFGTSYDFVELYLHYLCLSSQSKNSFEMALSEESITQFKTLAARLEKMHGYNKHKYIGASPAVHLDLYPSSVPGGWKTNTSMREQKQQPDKGNKIVGEFSFSPGLGEIMSENHKLVSVENKSKESGSSILLANHLLSGEEVNQLLTEVSEKTWIPVGTNGYQKDYAEGKSEVGSYRVSAFSQELATVLWERLSGKISMLRSIEEKTPWDGEVGEIWRPVGVSPLFRFIKYVSGGKLVPHYDAPYAYNENKQTMMSVVIYLTAKTEGGATRFIVDGLETSPRGTNPYRDWERLAKEEEIDLVIEPEIGNALIFDHRILHDSSPLVSGEKVVIRTDIVFERTGVK